MRRARAIGSSSRWWIWVSRSTRRSDDHECPIAVSESGEAVTICVNVAPVVVTSREALFRHLLVMNYQDEVTMGATLGLTDDGDEILLRLTRPGDGLDAATLERLVDNLAALAGKLGGELLTWQKREAAAGGALARRRTTMTTAASGRRSNPNTPERGEPGTRRMNGDTRWPSSEARAAA